MNTKLNLGQPVVPATTVEALLESLTQIAGNLEQLSWQAMAVSGGEPSTDRREAQAESRIRQALVATVDVGDEAFTVAEVADAVVTILAHDGGPPLPESVIRSALPKLMLELFGAKLSCSIRRGDRFARGWRKISPKTVDLPAEVPKPKDTAC